MAPSCPVRRPWLHPMLAVWRGVLGWRHHATARGRDVAKTSVSTGDYLAALEPLVRADVDALRGIVLSAHPGLTEEIKWNAPSFAHDGQDRVTLGLDGKGGYRIVLHRGARPLYTAGFHFADEARLAVWPAPDRGVIALRDRRAIDAGAADLSRLIARWIEATR